MNQNAQLRIARDRADDWHRAAAETRRRRAFDDAAAARPAEGAEPRGAAAAWLRFARAVGIAGAGPADARAHGVRAGR